MAVTVRITETYDLKTTVDQLGLIAVHTPSMAFLRRMYPGLCMNHKFVRIMKADVVGACASVLPADPLQVGVTAGDMAPEDMFNPILYKAMTNEGFETILNRLYAGTDVNSGFGSVASASLSVSGANQFKTYYSLLAESKGWKKVLPQRGFNIRGLVPICYTMINTFGNNGQIGKNAKILPQQTTEVTATGDEDVPVTSGYLSGATESPIAISFRGKSVRMPRIPLHVGVETAGSSGTLTTLPKVFVLGMVLPPARLHEFYYRMRVTWTVRFEQIVSVASYGDLNTDIGPTADASYKNNYTYASSKAELEHQEDTVDTNGVSIEKIMES